MTKIAYRAYKYRLEPTYEQASILMEWADAKRFVWNKALALCENRLVNGYSIPRYSELSRILTLWKQAEEWKFLKNPPKDILQTTLKDLDGAFSGMFKRIRHKPRFKKKRESYRSFKLPSQVIKVDNNRIKLPKMKEWMKFRRSRRIKGSIKNMTISFDGLRWYVSVLCEVVLKSKLQTKPIGIDMGITHFATTSNGLFVESLDFERDLVKLTKHQESMARKIKGSVRWLKAKAKVQKAYRRIANKRNDYLHKESTKLAVASIVVVEDLLVKNMSKSAKGTIESPGKMVLQKRALNRSILAQGWNIFFSMMKYKVEANGGIFVRIQSKYTSQECSVCGVIDKTNRLSQSQFICKSCGYEANADYNAAQNILARGLRVIAQDKGIQDILD